MSLDFTTLVANTIERLIGSDGSPYEKRVDAEGHVASDKCIANEIPFEELPEGWCWTRLGNLLSLVSDGTHKTPQYTETGVLFLSVQNVSGGSFDLTKVRYISRETHEDLCRRVKPGRGDILLCRIGTLGKPIIVDVDYEFSIFVSLGLLRPVSIAIAEWICSCIDSPVGFAWIEKVKVGGGTHTFKINLGDIPDFILPLPPLAEQRRIVERVNQLMPLVEEYGGLEDAREALDAALPGRLRKSVLQLAVQGGLVPQDPADEPAGVLLERIRGQRRQLVAEGKMRAPKGGESIIFAGSDGRRYEKRVDARGRESEPVCIEDEVPFEIPEGWEWARLGSVFSMQAGKNIKASLLSDIQTENTPYPCFGGNGIRGFVAKPNASGDYPIIGRQGALCGNVRRASGDFYATEHAVIVHCFLNADIAWACLFLSALNLNQYATSTAQPGLAISKISEVLIPIPPLAEQHRIVDHFVMLEPLVTNQ
ncbi:MULTISPECIES: restriction endonuclease subunit S [Collinsella]|uniref:restriction endonuclease subunit S n=1 Tax=Collinsella TaxID=102106 RepID=UPI0013148904|nr:MULTISPECIES: restriction endonuclease subunit S [Collinsella]